MQESITEILSRPIVNLKSANKHVPKINHLIRMVKESCSATRHSLPFVRLPVMLTINIVLNNVKLLDFSPQRLEVFQNISPQAIMTDNTLN